MPPDENTSKKGLETYSLIKAGRWNSFKDIYPLQLQLEDSFIPVNPSGAGVDTI